MRTITAILICLLFAGSVTGQSKKERKKHKIKATTEWETVVSEGKTTTFKSAYEEFDKAGHSILKIEYGADGTVLLKETAVYDQFGNKTEETEMDQAKKKNVRRTFRYNAMRDLTEEAEYGGTGNPVKKTLFSYNATGNKTIETVLDSSGKVIKQVMFTYNAKSLKVGKQTIRGASSSETSKKWEYVYY